MYEENKSQTSEVGSKSKVTSALSMIKSGIVTNSVHVKTILVLLIVWEGYTRFFNPQGDTYFPSIEHTVRQSIEYRGIFLEGLLTTATATVGGFLLASVVGILLGTILAESYILRQLSLPGVIFAYSIPHAILAPIFFIWFGTGIQTVIAFAVWMAFFYVFVNTLTGMASVSEEFHQLGEVIGATRWQMIRYIKIWDALPNLTTGLKIAAQSAVVAAIIAEFIAGGSGLGHEIVIQLELNRLGVVFGVLIVLMLFATVWFKTVEWTINYLSPPR